VVPTVGSGSVSAFGRDVASVAAKMISRLIYFDIFTNSVLKMRFAKIMVH
jgi:hypothetical protein